MGFMTGEIHHFGLLDSIGPGGDKKSKVLRKKSQQGVADNDHLG